MAVKCDQIIQFLYSLVCFVLMIKGSKNIRSCCIKITWCFSLFVEIVKEKKMLSSTCNELTIISYFGKCEYDYCFNMLQEHDNNIFKECLFK